MTQRQDKRSFERWNSLLEKDQVQRLMDKYQEYGKRVVEGKWKTNYLAPHLNLNIHHPKQLHQANVLQHKTNKIEEEKEKGNLWSRGSTKKGTDEQLCS